MNQILLGSLVILVLLGLFALRLIDRTNGEIISMREKRKYLLYVPKSYQASHPVPLIITIHGFAQWPAHQMNLSRWNQLADEHGFIVVYPSGTRFPKRWRTRGMPGHTVDVLPDVTFLSDLIDKTCSEYNIDPARIYVNGMSNGAGMSFLLACELSERIAAVGMVAGAFPASWERCQPSRAVPAMVFHGTDDPIVPYQGGLHRGQQTFPAIPVWVEELARRNGCVGTPQEIPASGAVRGIRYTGCAAEVVFYTIDGGGHTWPGGKPLPVWITGQTSMDIDATRALWEFFQQHPLRSRM